MTFQKGELNPAWNGGRKKDGDGYIQVLKPEHKRSDSNGYVYEHIVIAEKAIGKPLSNGVVVHHINGIRNDNRNENFVICQNNTYHKLLHQREKQINDCGNVNFKRCPYCKEYDDIKNMQKHCGGIYRHANCRNQYKRERANTMAENNQNKLNTIDYNRTYSLPTYQPTSIISHNNNNNTML